MTDRIDSALRAVRRVRPRYRHVAHPVALGLVVTLVFTTVFHFAYQLFPTRAVQLWLYEQTGTVYEFENPLANVQFLGGFVGGAVAGYRTENAWIAGAVNGLAAGLLGIVGLYVLWAGARLANAIFVWNMAPPPLIESFLVPAIILLPFLVFNVVLGFVGGALGHVLG